MNYHKLNASWIGNNWHQCTYGWIGYILVRPRWKWWEAANEIKMRISGGEWSTNWEILFKLDHDQNVLLFCQCGIFTGIIKKAIASNSSSRRMAGHHYLFMCTEVFIPKYFPFSISSGAILQSTAQRICQNHFLVSMFAHLQSDEEDTRLVKHFFSHHKQSK